MGVSDVPTGSDQNKIVDPVTTGIVVYCRMEFGFQRSFNRFKDHSLDLRDCVCS
jgi:hypothetical protein